MREVKINLLAVYLFEDITKETCRKLNELLRKELHMHTHTHTHTHTQTHKIVCIHTITHTYMKQLAHINTEDGVAESNALQTTMAVFNFNVLRQLQLTKFFLKHIVIVMRKYIMT